LKPEFQDSFILQEKEARINRGAAAKLRDADGRFSA
jgi:hypothetical protein